MICAVPLVFGAQDTLLSLSYYPPKSMRVPVQVIPRVGRRVSQSARTRRNEYMRFVWFFADRYFTALASISWRLFIRGCLLLSSCVVGRVSK